MAFTYTDKNLKTVLHSWGRWRATISEAVQPGDGISFLNTGTTNAVQLADQSDSQAADGFACEEGAAGDTIWCALAVELMSASTIGTGGVVTRVYFAASSDFLGAKLWLGEDGKPSSSQGTTFTQVIGRLLARDRILLDAAPSIGGQITETLSGSTALNAQRIEVTDETTPSSASYARALYINTTVTGTKTGSAEHNAVGIDMAVQADTPYAYNLTLYSSSSGNPTVGFQAALSIYMDDPGSAVTGMVGIDIGLAGGSNSPADRHAFMRLRNHSAGAVPHTVFQIEGNNAADYLFDFDNGPGVGCVVSSGANVSGAGSSEPYLKIDVNGTEYGIPIIAI